MRSSKPHLGFREGNFRRGRLTNKTTNFTQTAKITHYTVFKTCLHNYVETHSTLCTPILIMYMHCRLPMVDATDACSKPITGNYLVRTDFNLTRRIFLSVLYSNVCSA